MNKTEALPEFLRQRFTGNWLLSDPPQQQKDWLCHAAADEIERLRTENEKLRAALNNLWAAAYDVPRTKESRLDNALRNADEIMK